ncbi:MAG: DUF4428 domain-containing protein, partial [Faecalicoccus sp.]|nr:DUF4428 domain-containing protein [Faecalicoccus sp.]
RKLEDGNLCKDCAKKLSPWFDERRHSTVAQIKEQLAYREDNKAIAANFHSDKTYGNSYAKLHIDETKKQFAITSSKDFKADNPDILNWSQAKGCKLDVRETRHELKQTIEGKSVSYDPPRYEYSYSFYADVLVDHPYFDDMSFQLNGSSVNTGEYRMQADTGNWKFNSIAESLKQQAAINEYNKYIELGDQIKAIIDGWASGMDSSELAGKSLDFETSRPIPYRYFDEAIGLDLDISLTCKGNLQWHVSNVEQYQPVQDTIENLLKEDLRLSLAPAIMKLSEKKISYEALTEHSKDIAANLDMLFKGWKERYGITIDEFNVTEASPSESDMVIINRFRNQSIMRDPVKAAAGVWICPSCHAENKGKFCMECGTKKPE